MALVATGFRLSVTLIDNGANTSTLNYDLVAADMTAATAASATILTRLQAITNAVVKGYTIAEKYEEDALTLPGSGVHVEDRAVISLAINGFVSKVATVVVPAPTVGVFVSASGPLANVVDVTDTDVRNYADIWGVTGALASISDGEFIDDTAANNGVIAGKRTHRQSSRG